MIRLVIRFVLVATGMVLLLVGGSVLAAPKRFLAANGIDVQEDPSLMSEMAAPSGIMIITALLMLAGVVRPRFTNLGLVAGGVVYGAYGVSRIVCLVIHGMPSPALITAALFELVVSGVLIMVRMTLASQQETRPRPPAPREAMA